MAAGAGTRRAVIHKRRKSRGFSLAPAIGALGWAAIGTVLLTGAGLWLVFSGTAGAGVYWVKAQAMTITADMGFKLNNLMVEGRVHTDPDMLKALLNIESGDPLLGFQPQAARAQLEKLPWVRHARVERHLPDTIFISLTERQPSALYQEGKSLRLLDEQGEFIATDDLRPFADFMIVMGQDAPAQYQALLQLLEAEPQIRPRVKIARWIGDRRWDLELGSGMIVKLPENNVEIALRRLAEEQQKQGLMDQNIMQVDLRDPARLIVRAAPGAAQAYQDTQNGKPPSPPPENGKGSAI